MTLRLAMAADDLASAEAEAGAAAATVKAAVPARIPNADEVVVELVERRPMVGAGQRHCHRQSRRAQSTAERPNRRRLQPARPGLAILLMSGVTAATMGLALDKDRIGKAHGSPGLQAGARHARLDAEASAGVALGVGLQWAGVPHMDSVAALVVSHSWYGAVPS